MACLSRRLEELNALDPDDETLYKIESVKLALNLEADKEEIEGEKKSRAN